MSFNTNISYNKAPENKLLASKMLIHGSLLKIQDVEIGEAFDLLDINKTKKICVKNLKFALKALGLELPRCQYIRLKSDIEKTSDGLIEKKVFIREMQKLFSNIDPKENMIKAFKLIDEQDTGKICFNDLKNIATLLGEKISDQEINKMLDIADVDGDGKVNLTEFIQLMEKACKIL
ncbi:uncharacterized protein LOC126894307 [Daktulosphaira vitifoliae]|uniref:uncharacterized protein LOC126894307 n=1 Tax=Daktulosphaira vitifoliae TaxID=58002 RepID=UPI0021AAD0C8|nr:uncharacterized protein LOC126894307 [Daktulosphaira vitifoliae]